MTRVSVTVQAFAHPLRVRIIEELAQGKVARSPSELADEFDAPLGNVSYHVRQLAAFGFLELRREVPRRGAVEHYYSLSPAGRKIAAKLAELDKVLA
jgi:DNA-binding transcriptional ArsR family regulator